MSDEEEFQQQELNQFNGDTAEELEDEDFEKSVDDAVIEDVTSESPDITLKTLYERNRIFLFISILLVAGVTTIGILFWDDLDWKGWVTIQVTLGTIIILLKDVAPPDLVLMFSVMILLVTTIIEPSEALQGFSNKGIGSVAVLFVVAEGIQNTGALDFIVRYVLKRPKTLINAQLRLLIPVGVLSGFLNNTPVVAMMIPVVMSWSKRTGLSHSKLLMPLSYIAILGGTCTLIGTSTNLVVVGLAEDKEPDLSLNIFEISLVGVPVAVVGLIYILIASPYLLLERESGTVEYSKNPREYSVAVRVKKNSIVVGKTIEEAGLRHLPGLFLFEIQRQTEVIAAPSPDTHIYEEDVLLFAGVVSSVKDLWKIEGLVPATNQIEKISESRPHRCLVECVVSPHSPLVNQTVRDSCFRSRYNAAIVAVHRQGEHVRSKIGEIILQGGDTLLLEAGTGFIHNYKDSNDFALISPVADSTPLTRSTIKVITSISIAIAMVIVNSLELLDLFSCALAAAFLMLLTRCLSIEEARASIKGPLLLTIAAAFGLASALEDTGVAENISQSIVDLFQPIGSVGILFGLYIATALLSALISNAATVALMFPIAYDLVDKTDLQLKAVLYVLMMGASSSFSTPISYQTNLMVYGPGGYKFGDFARFGVPLQLISCVVSVVLCHFIWNNP